MGLILQKSNQFMNASFVDNNFNLKKIQGIMISIIVSFVSSAALLQMKYLMALVIEDTNVVK